MIQELVTRWAGQVEDSIAHLRAHGIVKGGPGIPVKFDGDRHLKLGVLGVVGFENATYRPIFSVELWEHATPEHLAWLLWACLVHEDHELDPQRVADIFQQMTDKVERDAFIDKILDAWKSATLTEV